MAQMIADLYARLSALTGPYTAALTEATDEGEAFTEANKAQMEAVKASNEEGAGSFGILGKAAAGIAVGFVAASAVSMKWATSFQSTMETLHTQAGVAQSQIKGLGDGVLSLAGQVGFDPDSLAEALYHIESSFASVGITGPKAMDMLKIAAEGAATGHADLVDVTNALDAAIASGIPGVSDMSQAMGILNATVGAGDMQMQDLANAFSTGLLANVKSYGLSITDVGAALAVFGDNNIRGQNAATELRMAVQALAVPAATAAGQLQAMGMSSTTLASVMSKQGLLPALELLKQKMTAFGVTTQDQGEVLTTLFGKKAGAGITVLYDQLGRLQSKYPDLTRGANNFGNAWTSTKATVKQQLNEIGAAAQSAGIKFGQFLLPQVSKLLTLVTSKGGSLLGSLGKDLSQLSSGFSGQATATTTPDMGHAGLNQIAAHIAPPPLTPWQKIGQTARQIADDFATFGREASKAARDLGRAAGPTAAVLGGAFLGALKTVGSVLANQVGPAIEALASFLDQHKQAVADFAKVALALLAAKLTAIGTAKAATGIVGLANSILSFPKKQLDSITGAFGQLGTAWAGKKDDEGNIVGGLKNTLTSMYHTLSGGAKTMLKWGKTLGSNIADGIASTGGKVASGAKSLGGAVVGGVKSWGGKIGTAVKNVMPTKLDAKIFLQSVKDTGGSVASTIKGWGSGIAEAASGAASGLKGFATSAAEAATAAWSWVTATAASALSAGRAAIAWTADKLALIGTTIAEKAAAAGQWLLDAAMDANPITLIVIAIAALIGVFVLLWTKCAWFRDFWKGLWSDIKKLFSDAVSFVKTHVDLLVGILALPLLPLVLLAQHWKQVWSDIRTATAAAWRWIDDNVVQPVVRVFTTDIPSAIRTGEHVWNDVWTGFKSTAASVWHWVDSNVLQPARHFFSSVIGGALSTATTLWNRFWNGMQKVVNTVWGVIKPIVDTIKDAISTISGGLSSVSHAASSIGGGIVGKVGSFLGFDDGGFVPGANGAPMIAVVHGGEYVLSNDMLRGTAPIDNRALAGVLSARSGAGSGGGTASALAVGAGSMGGGSVTVINVNVQVAGNVTAEKKLADTIRTQILQFDLRNSTNGLSLAG